MLNGIKKELMFFTRSFRMWGVIIAAVVFAVASPLLMKLSSAMLSSIGDMSGENFDNTYTSQVSYEQMSVNYDVLEVFNDDYMVEMSVLGSYGDLTNTLMLIFMLVTMYSAGGELKKRSMIIPRNAGLSTKLYLLPKFIIYPLSVAVFAFCGILLNGGITSLLFSGAEFKIHFDRLILIGLGAAVYDAFIATAYFALGLCTAKAGIATIIMYGGSTILSLLFQAFRADKFHPYAFAGQMEGILADGTVDAANYWGSIGITLLIMLLLYFITVFVISAKKVDNMGEEGIML